MDPNRSPRAYPTHKKEEFQMKQKLLSVLLVLAMALTLLPTAALAEETEVTVQDGVATVSTADQLTAALTNTNATTIKLGGDITAAASVDNQGGNGKTAFKVTRAVILDLNGNTLSTSAGYTLAVNGESAALTIINSNSSKQGAVTNGTTTASSIEVVKGTMTLGSLSEEGQNNFLIDNNKSKGIKENSAIKIEETAGKVTVNGGTIGYAHMTGDAVQHDRSFQCFGNLEINGGTIQNDVQIWCYTGGGQQYKGSLTINGGNFAETADVYLATAENSSTYNTFPFNGATITIPANSTATIGGFVGIRGAAPSGGDVTATGTVTIAGGTIGSVKNEAQIAKIEITGGKFTTKPEPDGTTITIPAGKEFKQEGDKWVLGAPDPTYYEFTLLDANTDLLNSKKVSDLGEMTLVQDTTDKTKITITGKANYVEMTGFNNDVPAEEAGHYVAINIPVVAETKVVSTNVSAGAAAPDGKIVEHETEGNVELLIWMDGDRSALEASNPLKKGCTIAIGEGAAAVTYTIDFSGVTLLPKPASENVEVKPSGTEEKPAISAENSTAGAKVEVPEAANGEDGLSKVQIDVKSATASNVTTASGTDAAVSAAIKNDTNSKVIEVTVKTINEQGEVTDNTFTDETDALKANPIKVTITVETAGTYHVFCIKDDGTVQYYGYKAVASGSLDIEFTTKHLCHFAAVKETTDLKNAVASMTAVSGTGLEGSAATPTPGGITATWDSSAKVGASDGSVTISGLTTGTQYILKVTRGSTNVYLTVTAADNKVVVPCQADAVLSLLAKADGASVWANTTPAQSLR